MQPVMANPPSPHPCLCGLGGMRLKVHPDAVPVLQRRHRADGLLRPRALPDHRQRLARGWPRSASAASPIRACRHAGRWPGKPRDGAAGSPHHVVFVAEEQVAVGHDDGAARERPRWTGVAGLRTRAGPGAPAPVTWFKQSCKPVITLRYQVRPTPISGVRRASSWLEVHRDERSVAGQCHGTA
jgi:hypothetical protein